MESHARVFIVLCTTLSLSASARGQVVAPATRLVSASSVFSGTGNGESTSPEISDDGRFVAFNSRAGDLAPFDGNGVEDIFVRDMQTGTTTLVSVSMSGASGNAACFDLGLSADGRFVAFSSNASNLVPGDTFQSCDVFVRDLALGTTALVSIGIGGAKPTDTCGSARISGDGRMVCFKTRASNLVPGDTNSQADVFVRDMLAGTTTRVNVSASGAQSPWAADSAAISDDGRWVAFLSNDPALVPGDTNNTSDIFLKDLQTGAIEIVSRSTAGVQANDASYHPAVSENGRYVVFGSLGSNLVLIDKNTGAAPGDIFLRDRVLGTTRMVNVGAGTEQVPPGNFPQDPDLSPDGRFASFSINGFLIPWNGANVEHIYLKDLQTEALYRVSQGPGGTLANGRSFRSSIAREGRAIAFDSTATNFASPDNNAAVLDVFWHAIGSPTPVTYCTAKVNSLGCLPRISWDGWPGISTPSHFFIVGGNMLNSLPGLLLYGVNGRGASPFSGGVLCVQAPVRRAVPTVSTGNSAPGVECANAYLLDFQAFATGGLGGHPLPALQVPGTLVDAEWWGRDIGLAIHPSQLSDALEFSVMP